MTAGPVDRRRRGVLAVAAGSLALPGLVGRSTAQESYDPLGRVSIEGAMETVVGPGGDVVFVAATTGFATVDVSDPADPTVLSERRELLAEREDGPMRKVWDASVEGDRLLVVGPAGLANGPRGALLYDVSDPAEPERVAFHETEFPIHNAVLNDGVAYLTGNDREGNPLVAVDVRDDDPEEVGRWSLVDRDPAWEDVHWQLRWLHDVRVRDGTAYLAYWDAGTWLVDVSDPADPEHVARVGGRPLDELAAIESEDARVEVTELPGNDHYVTVGDDGALLGVGKEAWDDDETDRVGGPGGIELWDVADPESPRRLTTVAAPAADELGPDDREFVAHGGAAHMGCHECDSAGEDRWTTAHNFEIRGGRLYSSWYEGGVKIHDVSDPENPEELAWWRDPEAASFWTARVADEETFVAGSMGRHGDGKGALYTFPDRAGRQTIETETPAATNGTATPTTTSDPGATETASGTASDVASTGGQPGFGVAAAVLALGAGAWALLGEEERRRR